jgi:hypothetical protein
MPTTATLLEQMQEIWEHHGGRPLEIVGPSTVIDMVHDTLPDHWEYQRDGLVLTEFGLVSLVVDNQAPPGKLYVRAVEVDE